MFRYEQKFSDLQAAIEARGLVVKIREIPGYFALTISDPRPAPPGKSVVSVTRFVSERQVRLGYSTAWFQRPGKALYKGLVRALREWETR